jgi:acyl-CoA reductase-like NAD-dependent aldehyde dehydrogenase
VSARPAPACLCAHTDVEAAAQLIIESKHFDNRVICGSEHLLVVDTVVCEQFIAALEAASAAMLSAEEAEGFTTCAFDPAHGRLRRKLLGQSAQKIAAIMAIHRRPIQHGVAPGLKWSPNHHLQAGATQRRLTIRVS